MPHTSKKLDELQGLVKNKLSSKIDEYKVPVFWIDIDKMKEDAESMDALCATTAPPAPPSAGHAAVPADEEAAVGPAPSPTTGASQTDAPPLMVTPPASTENTAAEHEQQASLTTHPPLAVAVPSVAPPAAAENTLAAKQQQPKPPRKRRTKQEMLLAQKETYAEAISFCAKHGLENAPAKLKKEDRSAVLTLGLGFKVSEKIFDMRK